MADIPGLTSIRTSDLAQGAGVIAVYDISNRMTFDQLPTWLLRAKTHCPDGSPILLVGNKTDWEDREYGGREVSIEETRRFAKEYGCLLAETSAKQNVNVDLAFKGMAKWILAKKKNSQLQIKSLQELDNVPQEEISKKPDVKEKSGTVSVGNEYVCCYGCC